MTPRIPGKRPASEGAGQEFKAIRIYKPSVPKHEPSRVCLGLQHEPLGGRDHVNNAGSPVALGLCRAPAIGRDRVVNDAAKPLIKPTSSAGISIQRERTEAVRRSYIHLVTCIYIIQRSE